VLSIFGVFSTCYLKNLCQVKYNLKFETNNKKKDTYILYT